MTKTEFRPWVVYGYCLGIALLFLFCFGLNAPLHVFNPHCDYQWFLTMGRGMMAGKVLYRDLFEQKGPLVYVLFAVASCFPQPQIFIWFVEVLVCSLYLFFCYRIARKFLSPWLSLLVVPFVMMVYSANIVRGLDGSCVEEFCMPVFAYAFLALLEFLLERKPINWRRSLALGICLGIAFWSKYTMLEFFLFPLIIWVVVNLVEHKVLSVVRSGLIMFGGFALVTLPVIVSFAALGALDDLWQVYFAINIHNYSGAVDDTQPSPWQNFGTSFGIGGYFAVVMLWGLICFAVQYWRQKSGWLLLLAVIPTWVMIGFFCGIAYYYLPLYVYSVLGVIYAVKVVAHMLISVEITIKRRAARIAGLIIALVLSVLAALPFVPTVKEIHQPRENYAPLVVAEQIHPKSLFCYYIADCGFYNAAGIIPDVRYFAQNTFTPEQFPAMYDAFAETIRSQHCDYVITYLHVYKAQHDFLAQYYHPYTGDIESSTLTYNIYEPTGYLETVIVVLARN